MSRAILRILMITGVAAATGSAGAETPTVEIVGPLPDQPPQRSSEHDPSSTALIETWLGGSLWPNDKRFDQERYQILDRRLTWGKIGHAVLAFRLLPLKGDALTLARTRCPQRKTPIDIQIYYEWSDHTKSWVAIDNRGDPGFETCPAGSVPWTQDQIAKLVDPPPLPVPPKVEQKDVVTPPPGSAERAALLDGVRPIYEKLFGKPIKFNVQSMRMAAGFAFMSVHPERPNGSPIETKIWHKVIHDCEHTPASVMHEYWMKKVGKAWTVARKNDFCADDSILDQGDIVGAPPQLVDKAQWEERNTYPLD